MPNPLLNIGSAVNDHTGDNLRTVGQKLNRLPNADSTINAGSGDYSGTTEQKITAAIAAAVLAGAKYVWVPQSMLPYNASLVTFNAGVQMIREGGPFQWYDVKAYGASGNDATSDTAATQAAVTAAAPGGTIFFAPGTYLINSIIFATTANLTFRGMRGASILKKNANLSAIVWVQANFCNIQELTFDGNAAAGFTGRCLLFGALGNIADFGTVSNCIIKNATSFGIEVNGSRGCRVEDSYISGCLDMGIFGQQNAIQLAITRNWVDATSVTAATAPAIGLHSTSIGQTVSGARISENYCKINQTGSFGIEVGSFAGDQPRNVDIVGNVVESTGSVGGGISVSGADHTAVVGNTYEAVSGNPTIAGIEIALSTFGTTVTGNVVKGSSLTGINVDQASHCVISGNIIDQPLGTGWGIRITSSVAGVHARRNVVSANRIIAPATGIFTGIQLQANGAGTDVSENVISDNHIEGNGVGGSLGIDCQLVAGTLNDTTLSCNTIRGVATGINGSAGVTLTVFGSRMASVPTAYGGAATYFRYDPQQNTLELLNFSVNSGGKVTGLRFTSAPVTLTDAATIALDASGSNFYLVTLGGNRTMGSPTNPVAGQRIQITVIQDGTGGRTLAWNAVFKVSWSDAGNTLSKRSSIAFVYDGTNWNQDGAQTPYV
jgi:hypothetical protein